MVHPFFWSAEKRVNFLVDVSDHFEWEPRDPPSQHLQILESTAPKVLGSDFLKKLDKAFIDTLGKQRKYTGSKMLDLLRALRNKVSPDLILIRNHLTSLRKITIKICLRTSRPTLDRCLMAIFNTGQSSFPCCCCSAIMSSFIVS